MRKKRVQKVVIILLAFCLVGLVSLRIGGGTAESDISEKDPQPDDEEPRSQTSEIVLDVTPDALVSGAESPSEQPEVLPNIADNSWRFVLVNNTHVLDDSFVPNVVETEDGQYIDERVADHLQVFLNAAREAGYTTYLSTAYRPIATQRYIFFGKASQIAWGGIEYEEAEMMARDIVAYPGTSEHQLATAVDIMDSSQTVMDAEAVEDMPLLVWLREHCAEYGFILRYPKDKEEITGWYEPWHFRYVGVEAAEYMTKNNLCLEEFLDLY